MPENLRHLLRLDPLHWREGLLTLVLWIVTVLGAIVYVPSVYMALRDGLVYVVWVDTAALAGVLALLLAKRMAFRIRAGLLCTVFYLLGTGLLFWVGPISQTYLLAFSLVTTLLLGLRTGLAAAILGTVTLAVVGLAGMATATVGPSVWLNADGPAWLVIALNFALANISLTLAVGGILAVLETGLRREAEGRESLRQSQSMLAMAMRVSRMGAWAIDRVEDKLRLTWSEGMFSIHELPVGFPPELDEGILYYANEDQAKVSEAVDACFRDGTPIDAQWVLLTAKNRRILVHAVAEAVRDEAGRIVRIHGTLQDLTEDRETQLSLLRSERRYFELADSMPFMVWTATPDGGVDYANAAFRDYIGEYSGQDLGTGWFRLLHPDDRERTAQVWAKAVRSGEPYQTEFRIRRGSDGEYRWHRLHATAVREEDGRIHKWYGSSVDIHEIKLAEKKSKQIARRLEKTLESITDAFVTFDREWRFTYVNSMAEQLLGRSRESLLDKNVWDEFAEGINPEFRKHLEPALDRGEPVSFEAVASFGKLLEVRAFPSSVGLAVYFRDVTMERAAREADRLHEQRLQLITRATNDLIWDFDAAKSTIWWGEGFEAFFGPVLEGRETGESFWEERVHPDDRERTVSGINTAFVGDGDSWTDEYRLRRADGIYVHVLDRGYILRDDDGKAIRMIGGLTDLTDRMQKEEALRRLTQELERERAKLLVAQSVAHVGSWETDLTTYEVTWSEECYRIFEKDPSMYTPTHEGVLSQVHPEDRDKVTETFLSSVRQTAPQTIVHRIITDNGNVKYLEQNWKIELDENGMPIRATGTGQDITLRVSLEEQFRQSQKMEAVGRLAGGIAHDFNNMLTVILVRSERAMAALKASDPLRAGIQEIYDAAERSAALTRQLLTYARRQEVQARVLDLNETVENALKMLRRLVGEDVRLEWSPGAGLWPVKIDPAQVDQILTNLCVNARDAIRDVGTVTIETHNVTFDAEYCRRHSDYQPGDYVMLAVTDDGAGMSEEIRSRIFDPFFTTKEPGRGTGLGLPTVYGIVQQNRGFIHVYSEPGKGTTFKIYLVREAQVVTESFGAAQGGIPRGNGEVVLVVEDEAMILEVAVEILEGLGYHVLSADSPDTALAIAAKAGTVIDVMMTDVVMPGMNGRDLVDRIRKSRPHLRVLFMSGYTAQVMEHRGMVEGREDFIQKPFSISDLAIKIRATLDSRDG